MKLPRYGNYFESGTDWLGEVPVHWRLVPLWTLFRRTKRTGFEGEQLLSVYRDFGVVPKASGDDNNNKSSDDLSVYQLVEPGDLAINKMKAWQGAVAISGHRGIVSPAYFIYESMHDEYGRFLHYLLRSPRYITGYLSISKGIRINQWDLEPQYHSRMPVLLPPRDEQVTIAAFLDRETAKIDALIVEQEKLIALLAEKRQSTISHAVTKGLNPSAPMKDSGIPWLGEVPAHWEIVPLKYVAELRSGGTPSKENLDYWDGDIPWASAKDLKVERLGDTADHITQAAVEGGEASLVRQGAILVVVRGMILARMFPVVETLVPMAINQDLKAVLPSAKLSASFLAWLLRGSAGESMQRLDEAGHGTKALRMDAWTSIKLPIPPLEEQALVAEFVVRATTKLDALRTSAVRAIDLLKERRSALIAAAVTGQIDVRGEVAEVAA